MKKLRDTEGEGSASRALRKPFRGRLPLALGLCSVLLGACGSDPTELTNGSGAAVPDGPRDLSAIRESGSLRVLVQRRSRPWLPRAGSPLDADRERVDALAADLKVEPVFVAVDRFDQLIPALLEGRGDLIAENLTLTPERSAQVSFSVPLALARDQLVTRASDEALQTRKDLDGRTLAVQRSSSFWNTAQDLQAAHPRLEVRAADENLDVDALLDGVATGALDLTLMDSNVMDAVLQWRKDLRVALDAGDDRLIAWATHPEAPALHKAVDGFLAAASRTPKAAGREIHRDDLAGIRDRGVLRVLTRNNSTSYFISRGELVGFEYDLVRRFAEDLGLRLEILVPTSHGDLFEWLREGKADLIAAGVTADADRALREDVVFSRSYHEVRPTVVARAGARIPSSLDELADRTFAVRRSSAYWHTLERLRGSGKSFALIAAPEQMETEEIIARVAEGDYDLTLADSHILAVARSWRDDVEAAFELDEPAAHGWVVRRDNPELLAAVDAYLQREYRGLFYNVTREKYFGNPKAIRKRAASRPARAGAISPYDELVRRHAARLGFDWRLVTAQMYQESRFDPTARSFAGASGLLQLMPRTAAELGYRDLEDPETSIEAALDYMTWLRNRFSREIPEPDRTWFSLAAYNVGLGHVRDARRIANERGWDADRWFDHVEQAMLLKERPEVHRKTRYGYARGREPVAYVRNIRDRYAAYVQADHALPD